MTFDFPNKPEEVSEKHYSIMVDIVNENYVKSFNPTELSESEFIQEFKSLVTTKLQEHLSLIGDVASFHNISNMYMTSMAIKLYEAIKEYHG